MAEGVRGLMDFKWLPGKVGTPVIVPAPIPDAPPIAGIIVPPATDIALRTAHSTWQGGGAGLLVTGNPKLAAFIAIVTGLLALVRSWLSHRKQAKAR